MLLIAFPVGDPMVAVPLGAVRLVAVRWVAVRWAEALAALADIVTLDGEVADRAALSAEVTLVVAEVALVVAEVALALPDLEVLLRLRQRAMVVVRPTTVAAGVQAPATSALVTLTHSFPAPVTSQHRSQHR